MDNHNKIFLSIDGDNLFFIQKSLGWKIDAEKLRNYVGEMGKLVNSNYYLSSFPDGEDNKGGFIKALFRFGYSVINKPVKTIELPDGSCRHKASLDIKIVIDAMTSLNNYDIFVLISGDSDFDCLLESLKLMGKQVYVISTAGTVANELLEITGQNYTDFVDLKDKLERSEENYDEARFFA